LEVFPKTPTDDPKSEKGYRLTGDVDFDENGDNNVAAGIKVARDGEFVLVTE